MKDLAAQIYGALAQAVPVDSVGLSSFNLFFHIVILYSPRFAWGGRPHRRFTWFVPGAESGFWILQLKLTLVILHWSCA